jgi:GNAT superfamily N-acetyltransferase
VPADAAQIERAFDAADAKTLHSRFLGAPPHVGSRLLTYLTGVDYVRRFALVAGEPETGRGVGVARYESCGDTAAEVAVVVDPAWRRVGLATAMVELLAEAAIDRGIDTFVATYIAANRPVTALLDLVGHVDRRQISQGIAEIAVHLDRDRVTTAVSALDRDPPPT